MVGDKKIRTWGAQTRAAIHGIFRGRLDSGRRTCKAVNCNVSAHTQSARRINSFNMLCMHVKHNAVRPRGKCNGHNLGPAIRNAQTFEAITVNVRQHFRDATKCQEAQRGVKEGCS